MPTTDECLSCKQTQDSLAETWQAEITKLRESVRQLEELLNFIRGECNVIVANDETRSEAGATWRTPRRSACEIIDQIKTYLQSKETDHHADG